jgi:hypothetical protein
MIHRRATELAFSMVFKSGGLATAIGELHGPATGPE